MVLNIGYFYKMPLKKATIGSALSSDFRKVFMKKKAIKVLIAFSIFYKSAIKTF